MIPVKTLLVVAAILFIAGCTQPKNAGDDMKALPEVAEFLSTHPDAVFRSEYWPSGSITDAAKAECGKISKGDYWRGEATSSEASLIIWADSRKRALCFVEKSAEKHTTTSDKIGGEPVTTTIGEPGAAGFGSIYPENWELRDDGVFSVLVKNTGAADIKMISIKADGSERAVNQSTVGAGGDVWFQSINVGNLAEGQRFNLRLSIVYELKTLVGERLESSGTITGFVKGVQKGKTISIASVNCNTGDVLVANTGKYDIRTAEIRVVVDSIVLYNSQDVKPNGIVKVPLNLGITGKSVKAASPANEVAYQC